VDIVAIYRSLTTEPTKKESPKQAPTTYTNGTGTTPNADALRRYVEQAVTMECDELRNAGQGNRNERLNAAAFSLGTLVGAGALERSEAEAALRSAAAECGLGESETLATLTSGLDAGSQQPRDLSEVAKKENRNSGYTGDLDVTADDAQAFLDEGGEPAEKPVHNPWPYRITDGITMHCTQNKDGEITERPVCDWYALTVEEIIDEDGSKTSIIEGVAKRGGAFRVEIAATKFADDKALRGILEQAAGALDTTHYRMAGHLGSSIKKLTPPDNIKQTRRFRHTGWHDGGFLIPGLKSEHKIELPAKLPYSIDDTGTNQTKAVQALDDALSAIDAGVTVPIFVSMLNAPLHRRATWQAKKYGCFVQGRTGSLKTSWVQTIMCCFGATFMEDASLLKWGEGATRNALMTYATAAHDLPFFIDNYKPNTGDGATGFVNLIHNIVEGSNRERSMRDGTVKPAAPIHAFPICTGEDVPVHDAATLARLFVISFPWQRGVRNTKLAQAQRNAKHLPLIGRAWLTWLMSDDAQAVIKEVGRDFDSVAARWATYMTTVREDTTNANRIAESLAANEMTWRVALRHPLFGSILEQYRTQYANGLLAIATFMANNTAEALEAKQFLNILRELVASKQYVFLRREIGETDFTNPNQVLGWMDAQGFYLLPNIALSAARRLGGSNTLLLSAQALYSQLDKIGVIASKDKTQTTKAVRIGDKVSRVLHLVPTALDGDDFANQDMLQALGV
jgi:hypothetical protein